MEYFLDLIGVAFKSSNDLFFSVVIILFLVFALMVFIHYLSNDGLDDLGGKLLFFIMIVVFGLSIIFKFFQIEEVNNAPINKATINQEKIEEKEDTKGVVVNEQPLKKENGGEKNNQVQKNSLSENTNEVKKDSFVQKNIPPKNVVDQKIVKNKEEEAKQKQVMPSFFK
jgi:uncharacterized membrane protein